MSGTQSIASVSDDGQAGVVVVLNLVDETDPRLLSLAVFMVCPAT